MTVCFWSTSRSFACVQFIRIVRRIIPRDDGFSVQKALQLFAYNFLLLWDSDSLLRYKDITATKDL